MRALIIGLILIGGAFGQHQQDSTSARAGSVQDSSAATHTLPVAVVATVGALPSSGCKAGELAVVTGAPVGQQIYQDSGTGSCVWTQQANGNAGATVAYTVGSSITMTCPSAAAGTVVLFEPSGGTALSASATITVSGCTNSATLTSSITFWFKQAASGGPYAVTMPMGWDGCSLSITASSVTACSYSGDGTTWHIQGDISGTGVGSATQFIYGATSVPLCSGISPAANQFYTYTTGGSPNPCMTLAAPFALTTTGSTGASTFSGGTLNVPQYAGTLISTGALLLAPVSSPIAWDSGNPNTVFTAHEVRVEKFEVPVAQTFNSVSVIVDNNFAGAGSTGFLVGVYDAACSTLLGRSNVIVGATGGGTANKIPLTASLTLSPGAYYVAFTSDDTSITSYLMTDNRGLYGNLVNSSTPLGFASTANASTGSGSGLTLPSGCGALSAITEDKLWEAAFIQ